MSTIGQRFKKIRTALNFSQTTFGEKLSMSKSGISAVENDKVFVSIDVLRTLFFDLKININWFISGCGEMFEKNCENSHNLYKNEEIRQDFKNWGKRLAQILTENGLTPRDFSNITGVSQRRIEKFISESVNPMVDEINAIKENIDVSIDWLLYSQSIDPTRIDTEHETRSISSTEAVLTKDEILQLKKMLKGV